MASLAPSAVGGWRYPGTKLALQCAEKSPPAEPTETAPGPGYMAQSQTLAALEQAKQVELQKKLAESGSESVTLSQQENMQIKGQSARHLVMQKLIGMFK